MVTYSPSSELVSVPEDLRTVLEQCLAEEATPDNLELYLPSVRQIITNLLQGLRGKQSIYRRIVSDHRDKSGGTDHERTDSRSSRTSGSSRREGGHRSQGSRQITDEERPDNETITRRNVHTSSRRRDPTSQGTISQQNTGNSDFVGGFAPSLVDRPAGRGDPSDMQPNDYSNSQRRSDRTINSTVPAASSSSTLVTPTNDKPNLESEPNEPSSQPPVSTPPPVPASVKRYSLVDKPVDKPPNVAPSVVVDPSSPQFDQDGSASPPPPETPPIDPPPAVAKSLAALKSDVHLERRASKRFSVYNISKMTGASTTRERSVRGAANHPNRRSAATGNLTMNDLTVLTEVDDEDGGSPSKPEGPASKKTSRSNTPDGKRGIPVVPPLPSTPSRTPEPTPMVSEATSSQSQSQPPTDPSNITIFLQLGREVKKVVIDRVISFASLRVLFVDKFSYNPGLDNFPAIYIRDPSSGVQYELEDTDDVKEKCLISLNIERMLVFLLL